MARKPTGGIETTDRTVSLPAVALPALRRAVASGSDPLTAIQSLQAAGFETGGTLFGTLEAKMGRATDDVSEDDFWRSLSSLLEDLGWGTVDHEALHPGVGILFSPDWVEGAEPSENGHPTCSFSSGLLSGLLSSVAGGPVAVLQIACRACGDDRCGFAFGSEKTIHDLYDLMLEESELNAALDRL